MLTIPEDPGNLYFFSHDRFYIYPWPSKTGMADKELEFSAHPYLMNESAVPVSIVPDYVIVNQKLIEECNITFNDPAYSIVYAATVQGAPLAQVYKKADV